MSSAEYIDLYDDICCVRDLIKAIDLASGMIGGVEANALGRVAEIAMERVDRALEQLEGHEPVPNVIRKVKA